MTTHELKQLFYYKKEIEMHQQRIAELEAMATDTTSKITGLPRGTRIVDKTALAGEIADLKKQVELKSELCVLEYSRTMRFVLGVEDSLMRQILSYRHISWLTWREIAQRLGGGNTEDSVRMMHSRFLKRMKK